MIKELTFAVNAHDTIERPFLPKSRVLDLDVDYVHQTELFVKRQAGMVLFSLFSSLIDRT